MPDPKDDRFGRAGDLAPFRFHDFSDSLDFNVEVRGFWDYLSHRPAKRDTVLGGSREPDLDVLILEPVQLFQAFENTFYLRFEFERHEQRSRETEYPGFLIREGLTGSNTKSTGATFPNFLIGGARETDTAYNAVALSRQHPAGIFADDMWHPSLYLMPNAAPAFYARTGRSRKMLLRLRVRVDQAVRTTARKPPILCIITRTEKDEHDTIRTIDKDTIRVGRAFKHVNRTFDTIDIPFIRDAANPDDQARKLFFSFYWPKQVNATFDYMELLTAHIEPHDKEERVQVGMGNFGSSEIAKGWASAFSAEDFLERHPQELGDLISRIKRDYLGHINYIRIGDEFPIAQGLPFKRLVKLMRDSTNGMIEVFPFTGDSGIGWFGESLPNAHVFNFEGARLGWVDTNYFADPKMLFFDPYVFSNYLPLPKRTPLTDPGDIHGWENLYIPSGKFILDNRTLPKVWNHYSPEHYQLLIQYKALADYLSANREAKRWTMRQNNGSHFGIDWQAGAAPELVRQQDLDTSRPQPRVFWQSYESLRPPTGAEMKVTGHLTTSCGGLGLLLYLLMNPPPGVVGPNGGIKTSTGAHDSMYHTTYLKDDLGNPIWGTVWTGFTERYDSVRALVPILKSYGTTLLHSKYIGDWLASELAVAPDSTQANLPILPTSIRTFDDALQPDVFAPAVPTREPLHLDWPILDIVADTANRTFVHISVWVDTLGQKHDTMLYIINMRTDDSYTTTETVSTIDRRYITIKLKTPCFVMDLLDSRTRANGKLLTPYVGIPTANTLSVRLLAGDGILVKLSRSLGNF
jgi:hypothetical protein